MFDRDPSDATDAHAISDEQPPGPLGDRDHRRVILKSDIESMQNTGLSLMPEGLDEQISVDEMADLIDYLMRAK